jgi:gas vesicle protein
MSNNHESGCVGGYLAAFAIGAVVGTGIALLYAPRSGKETRDLLAKKGRDLKGKASDALEDVADFVHGKKAELAAAVEAGKEAMREERAKHQKAT